MSDNNRQFPRQDIQIEVELNFLEDDSRTVVTRDMSQGGLFMQLDNTDHYTMGEMVTLRFKNPLANFDETAKDAVIVRHAEGGIAVAFVEIDAF